jgi:hypothetical protein
LTLIACASACSAANAALLTVEPAGISSNGVYTLYLAGESTVFNALGLSVKPNGDAMFLNLPAIIGLGIPRPPGGPYTDRNRALDEDPSEYPASRGWTLLGVQTNANGIVFSGGPLGRLIDTSGEPDGKLFLANLMLPPGATATATLQLVNGVDTVYTQTLQFPIPEPAGIGMMGLGTLTLFVQRRNPRGRTQT